MKTVAAVPNGRGCISGVSSGAGAWRRMRQRTTRFARVVRGSAARSIAAGHGLCLCFHAARRRSLLQHPPSLSNIFSESTLPAHQFAVKSRSPPSYIAAIREPARGESVIERESKSMVCFHCRKIAYFMFTHDLLPLYSQSIWSTRRIAVKTAAAVPKPDVDASAEYPAVLARGGG